MRGMTPAGRPLQLLVVEDAEFDYAMLLATLQAQGWPCEARRVDKWSRPWRSMPA